MTRNPLPILIHIETKPIRPVVFASPNCRVLERLENLLYLIRTAKEVAR